MVSFFHNPTLAEHQYAVYPAHGGKTVGNDEGSALANQPTYGFLNQFFGLGVQIGGGFVQNQYTWVGEYRPGDG